MDSVRRSGTVPRPESCSPSVPCCDHDFSPSRVSARPPPPLIRYTPPDAPQTRPPPVPPPLSPSPSRPPPRPRSRCATTTTACSTGATDRSGRGARRRVSPGRSRGRRGASSRDGSGSQEPTSGGAVTGLVFEGKGRFQMAGARRRGAGAAPALRPAARSRRGRRAFHGARAPDVRRSRGPAARSGQGSRPPAVSRSTSSPATATSSGSPSGSTTPTPASSKPSPTPATAICGPT